MNDIGKTIVRDGIVTLAMRVANTVLALVLGVATARGLGPAGRGEYLLPSIYAAIAISLFSGLMTATSYFMLNQGAGRGVLRPAAKAAALFLCAGAAPVVILAWLGHSLWAVLPAVVALAFAAVTNIATGYAYGIKSVRFANAISLFTTVLTLGLMLLGFYLVSRSATVAIVAWLSSTGVIAAVAAAFVIIHSRGLPSAPVPLVDYIRFAWKVGLVNFVTLLDYRIDVYIVTLFATLAALGVYTVAVSGAESILIITQVASIVTAPHIGSLGRAEAGRLTARAMRNNLVIALLMSLALCIVAPPLIALLYGPSFLSVVAPFRVLLIGVVALADASIAASYFTLQLGRPDFSLRIVSFGAALCCIMSLILVPRIGIIGAAIATTVSYVLSYVWMLVLFTRTSGIPLRDTLLLTASDLDIYGKIGARIYGTARRLRAGF